MAVRGNVAAHGSAGESDAMVDERSHEPADETETVPLFREDLIGLDGIQDLSEPFLIRRSGNELSLFELRGRREWLIGRARDAQIIANDAEVSRHHAKLMFANGALTVEDLGSRNGTLVNGHALRSATVRIGPGDIVVIGECQLIVATQAGRVWGSRSSTVNPSNANATEHQVDIVLADPEMARVYASVRKVARMMTTVLILGETGSGKDVLAQQLHQWSPRADKPLVRVNCAGIPETLLESELFGYERGAFTGADRRKAGYFEAAQGGTIFLDEIGELSATAQVKLLNVLENRALTRLGGTSPIPVDVRVVCATHRDLQAFVGSERFRADLYYRISPFMVRVPPLRDRLAEICLLAEIFVNKLASQVGGPPPTIAPDAITMLMAYPWPGNVRELRNAVEHAFVMADGATLRCEHFPSEIQSGAALPPSRPPMSRIRQRVNEVERKTIEEAIAAEGGNQTRAAARLGISRRTLVYKLAQYRRED
ncbi:sigma 54-interacting transcriptional regulator [Pendulispora brunnea]|uniref:Sigma 54-interacting transcriptional regulator n=1 Tax=Pendulispora brunnea TaxID=2905690 RepID=A0ABZ2K1T8_9BACT